MSDDYSGYPRGWFIVAMSEELASGDVRPMRYFGQDLVLFRTESGEAKILDAHCPHLGAHLGHGGTVEGDAIRCPFHAWEFDGNGACTKVPYANKIPSRATLRSWPVAERNGSVFVYHDPAEGAADWEVPVMPEYGDPEWMPWSWSILEVKTHPREIVENVADSAHFPRVHGTHVDHFENEYVGHKAIQRTRGIAYPRGGGKDRFSITATYHGPGLQLSEMESFLENRLLLAHTPIDQNTLHLRFGVSLKIVGDAAKTAGFAEKYIQNLTTGFHEDIAIWENKAYRAQPSLCDGDGPIGKLRRWYKQFYAAA